MRYPNILYIHSHDTGRYIQPYGHAVPTPNLQRLAEEGRHVLVMTGDGSRFELQLSRQSLIWYLRRAWQAEILA